MSGDDAEEPSTAELKARVERLESYLFHNRRDVLKGAAVGGSALGLLGFGAGSAAAQASTSDSDGNVGTPSNPVDLFADAVEFQDASADPDNNGEVTLNGSDVKAYSGGSIRNLTSPTFDELSISSIGARITQNSQQSIPASSSTEVQFDQAQFEHTSVVDADLANNQLVIQKAGIYLLTGSISFSDDFGDGTQLAVTLGSNGSAVVENKFVIGGSVGPAISTASVIESSSTDQITLSVFQNDGGSRNTTGDRRVSLVAIHVGG